MNVNNKVSDYKDALEEREQKLRGLKSNKGSLIRQMEEDEIQNDFYEDQRTQEYHKQRRQAKNDERLQQEIMAAQKIIFNQ